VYLEQYKSFIRSYGNKKKWTWHLPRFYTTAFPNQDLQQDR
jgi:hypothetical protein